MEWTTDDKFAIRIVAAFNVPNGVRNFFPSDAHKVAHALRHLDLSPLSKFLGKGRTPKHWGNVFAKTREVIEGDRLHDWVRHDGEWRRATPELLRMYGWPIDTDTTEPPKSPQDKALDDFIAKRKAKREAGGIGSSGWVTDLMKGSQWTPDEAKAIARQRAERERSETLDRAMSKLAPHALPIHERLMATKGCEL